jgi:hypothetical protein
MPGSYSDPVICSPFFRIESVHWRSSGGSGGAFQYAFTDTGNSAYDFAEFVSGNFAWTKNGTFVTLPRYGFETGSITGDAGNFPNGETSEPATGFHGGIVNLAMDVSGLTMIVTATMGTGEIFSSTMDWSSATIDRGGGSIFVPTSIVSPSYSGIGTNLVDWSYDVLFAERAP